MLQIWKTNHVFTFVGFLELNKQSPKDIINIILPLYQSKWNQKILNSSIILSSI